LRSLIIVKHELLAAVKPLWQLLEMIDVLMVP